MNQEQAKFIDYHWDMISMMLSAGCINTRHSHTPEMREHIKKFAQEGRYQFSCERVKWDTWSELTFGSNISNYRPAPERKIDWEKAMSCEPTPWGYEFLFWDEDPKNTTKGVLLGYSPGSKLPFFSRGVLYKNCKPLPRFIVPESWYEDDE